MDSFPLTSATIVASPADVAAWPATATITQLDVTAQGVHIEFTKKQEWPDQTTPGWGGPLQYTLWLFMNVNGQWTGSGIVEYWRDLAVSGGAIYADNQIAKNWVYDSRWGAMQGHQPVPGETIGFMVTAGDARNNFSNLHERSNVVTLTFPSGPQTYTFAEAPAPSPTPSPVPMPPLPAPVPVTADVDLSKVYAKLDLILAQLTALSNKPTPTGTAPIYTGSLFGYKLTLTPQK